MWPAWMFLCFTASLLSARINATNITIRLKDGPTAHAGRVEIYYDGIWGSLCDDGLNLNVGHVICKQLGYPEAIAVPCCSAFGGGSGPFWLSDVKCKGNESSLADCQHGDWGDTTSCAHRLADDASVICKPSNFSISYPLPTRLVYFSVPYAGCIELKYADVWGDIWQFNWDIKDGRVVCRQLGYPDVVTVLWRCSASFKWKFNVVTWMNDMRCHGNESSLSDCVHENETYSSSIGYDAGVVCDTGNKTDLNIRLKGKDNAYSGRVEVFLAGIWGAIDRHSWDLNDAHVVCRQLGYSAAENAVHSATYMFDISRNFYGWLHDVSCLGNESSLNECPHSLSFVPGPVLDAGVVCRTNTSVTHVRLAGSSTPYAGRVEVLYAGMWGTIRNAGWDIRASYVVCRQLGYREAESAILYAVGPFGKGQGRVWLSNLRCEGHENTLLNCSRPGVTGIYWDHDDDAGVVCKNHSSPLVQTQIRLMNSTVSRAGRVEVLYAGVWGTISGVNWTLFDAQVICTQLGFPAVLAAPTFGAFGPGDGPTWLTNVRCVGNETMVSACQHDGWSSSYPVHHTDAAVVCADNGDLEYTDFTLRLVSGSSPNIGRVEIQFGGVWGRIVQVVSLRSFGHVVCAQLGYPGASEVFSDSSSLYGNGAGPVWMAYVSCQGNESTISECAYQQIYPDHQQEPGVSCIAPTSKFLQDRGSLISGILKIGLPITLAVLFLVLVLVFYFRCFRKERAEYDPRRELMTMSDVSIFTENGNSSYTFTGVDTAARDEESKIHPKEDWREISRDQISLGEMIGAELLGVTYQGRVLLENGNVVECIVKSATGGRGPMNDGPDLLSDLRTMGCLGTHPNILNLIGACTIRGPTYLIFEDAEHGNLLDYLLKNQITDIEDTAQKVCALPKVAKLRLALDISRGMKHVAEKKCIHRDLAARNVRLGKNGVAKLTNIGSSRDIYDRKFFENLSEEKLSAKWMAPETLESMHFSTESDVWSFGILLWEIETGGDVPYPEIAPENVLGNLKSGFRMKKPPRCSEIIYHLMKKCWRYSPQDRPSFSELCIVLDTMVARETTC